MPAKQKKIEAPPEKVALYDQLIITNPAIERKGAGTPYTSFNGNMFTFLSESGLMGIRLQKAEREAFIKKYAAALMVQHGATMKEYVAVPDDLLANTDELKPYLEMSYEYVKSLKPKPTKKK